MPSAPHWLALAGTLILFAGESSGTQPACAAPADCRTAALEAIASGDYELAHDYAWRVMQLAPRNDPAAMSLLARTQSLSGRGDDAFVMLRRLADAGVVVEEALAHDDFARARQHAEWPELLSRMERMRAEEAPAAGGDPDTARPPDRGEPSVHAPIGRAPAPRDEPPRGVGRDTSRNEPPGRVTRDPARSSPPAVAAALSLPPSIGTPVALAYDAVSQRFVLADESDHALKILSEVTGNATHLVRSGWAGAMTTTAVAIDPRRGDLWVAGVEHDGSALHRLQLISGRALETLRAAPDAGPTGFAALAVGASEVFVLDVVGRRVFSVTAQHKVPRVRLTLPDDIRPIGLAAAGDALYVSHTTGLLRADLATGTSRPVGGAAAAQLASLHALAWHGGMLAGLQETPEGHAAVRVRLNNRGTAAVAVEVIGPAASSIGTVARGEYYYLAASGEGSSIDVRRVSLR